MYPYYTYISSIIKLPFIPRSRKRS